MATLLGVLARGRGRGDQGDLFFTMPQLWQSSIKFPE